MIDFDTPPFVYGDNTADHISVSGNGWIAVGGTTADASFLAQDLPDPKTPEQHAGAVLD